MFMSGSAWIALATTALCAIPITVTDQKGRSIEIELISVSGDSVTFSPTGNPKEFTLPISNFEENSRKLILKQAELLPPAPAKIDAEVSIGKRRQKKESYYMVRQEVTCTIKLNNMDAHADVPQFTGRIVYLGENRRTPEILIVLSTQSFDGSLKRAGSITRNMKSFITAYDSDNKGEDNIGGFQYLGYVLALKDKDGKIIFDQCSSGSMKLALKANQRLLEDVLGYPAGKVLTDKLVPSKGSSFLYTLPE